MVGRANQLKKRRRAYYWGHVCEYLTIIVYFLKGYWVVERRHRNQMGEVDLIFRRGKNLVFVEVKARANREVHEVLTLHQQKRIINAARLFIAKNPKFASFNMRFDVMIWRKFNWRMVKHAWLVE